MPSKRALDFLLALLLIAITFLYAWRFVDFQIPPFEDAAMLMRYAQNLAGGHGIVWNIGEHPVDGATDFLFMATSAALIKIGIPVGRAIHLLLRPASDESRGCSFLALPRLGPERTLDWTYPP